jgi:hypothetical protein
MLSKLTACRRFLDAVAAHRHEHVNGVDCFDGELPHIIEAFRHGRRFLLLEENIRGGRWLSLHDSPQAAGDYSTGQEYAHEWEVLTLQDLCTGEHFTVAQHDVSWTRA